MAPLGQETFEFSSALRDPRAQCRHGVVGFQCQDLALQAAFQISDVRAQFEGSFPCRNEGRLRFGGL